MSRVYVIGTCDTKGDELRFACECVRRAGAKPILVDVSTAAPDQHADVTAETVAGHHPKGKKAVLGLTDGGQARHASPGDQDLRRRDLACRGDLAGQESANLLPVLVHAVKRNVTLGEISDVLREAWGVFRGVAA